MTALPSHPLYHLVSESEWRDAKLRERYAPESLQREGFVHCAATPEQVLGVAQAFFASLREPLLLLAIDPAKLGARVVSEAAAPVDGVALPDAGAERFPHVYGPIERNAIAGVATLGRGDGRFAWPARFEPLAPGAAPPAHGRRVTRWMVGVFLAIPLLIAIVTALVAHFLLASR